MPDKAVRLDKLTANTAATLIAELSALFDTRLWPECDNLYRHSPQTYIKLQDTVQLNVNLLLLARWLDSTSLPLLSQHHDNTCIYLQLNRSLWSLLNSKVKQRDITTLLPFRQYRRQQKSLVGSEQYQTLLTQELKLERDSQAFINHTLQHLLSHNREAITLIYTKRHNALRRNTKNYLDLFNLNLSDFRLNRDS